MRYPTLIAFIAASFAALSANALPQEYKTLVANKERAGEVRDSIDIALCTLRGRYAAGEREATASQITQLEAELRTAMRNYDASVVAVAQYERLWHMGNPGKSFPKEEVADRRASASTKVRANLIANSFFIENLSKNDYMTLCEAQRAEADVNKAAVELSKAYSHLLKQHHRYMEVATESEADSVAVLFNAAKERLSDADALLAERWSTVYDNKIYIYDLLMEGLANSAMLERSARLANEASLKAGSERGKYASDALVDFCYRKRALVEYESQLASYLNLAAARDSLKLVAAQAASRDYRISKLSLERRSFIVYEPLKVIKPIIYTSKNPVPQTKIYDYGTIYRIRIGLFSQRPNLSILRGITPLSYSTAYDKGLYAYYVGGFRTEQEAKDGVAYLKRLGFKAPVIVVWRNGEYFADLAEYKQRMNEFCIELSGVSTIDAKIKEALSSGDTNYTVSRVGGRFVVGKFTGRDVAERVATAVREVAPNATVKITKP